MDEDNCMLDVAKFFLSFTQSESCGKCPPCWLGTKRLLEILTRITRAEGTEKDMETLEYLTQNISTASLCALGQGSVNPVVTTMRHFRDEYEAHIKDKKCPAGVCKALIRYQIISDKCPNCGRCVKVCPQQAITPQGKKKPVILDESKCIKCGACFDTCNLAAIKIESGQK